MKFNLEKEKLKLYEDWQQFLLEQEKINKINDTDEILDLNVGGETGI